MRWTDPVDGLPRRHARVWLDAATWHHHLLETLDENALRSIERWIACGRPVVARRREPGRDTAFFAAIALPLAAARARIAFAVDRRAIVRVAPPLMLAEAIGTAPVDRRPALRDLVARGDRLDVVFRVYGSLAWQAISGEPCMTPASDVDLLWTAEPGRAMRRVLDLLTAWEAEHGLRADGEWLASNGDGVAWRELVADPDRVLVKHRDRVSLQPAPMVAATVDGR